MRYVAALSVFSLILAWVMKGYGWSLNFSLYAIPLAYAFFAYYLFNKKILSAIQSFAIVLGILYLFNAANFLSYLIHSGWNYYDHESRMVASYIALFQTVVYFVSQAVMIGVTKLFLRKSSKEG
jgi:hypothetical protein